jgi:hypothetical protein
MSLPPYLLMSASPTRLGRIAVTRFGEEHLRTYQSNVGCVGRCNLGEFGCCRIAIGVLLSATSRSCASHRGQLRPLDINMVLRSRWGLLRAVWQVPYHPSVVNRYDSVKLTGQTDDSYALSSAQPYCGEM